MRIEAPSAPRARRRAGDARARTTSPDVITPARRRATGLAFVGAIGMVGLAVGPTALDAQEPLSAHQSQRMERFLENRMACRGCHQIDGRGGMIGPILDGIRDRADYDHVFSMITDPAATVSGTIMPHQRMPDREARRLASYIMALPANPEPTIVAMPQAPPALPEGGELDGAALYARHCAACHGNSGAGDGWNVPNISVTPTVHADPAAMSQRPDDTLYDGIAAGGFVLDKSPLMPAFADLLSREQIRALVAHIRTLCACEQPAWARSGR